MLAHYGGKVQAQTLVGQSSFYSSNDPRLHFGLGESKSADIDVYWPNGLHEKFNGVGANQLLTLREGTGPIPSKGWPKAGCNDPCSLRR